MELHVGGILDLERDHIPRVGQVGHGEKKHMGGFFNQNSRSKKP